MFRNNELVKVTKHGVTVEGRIGSERTVFYPDSTVNKYGSGKMGRGVVGYKVHMPIIKADGTFHTDRAGQPAMGLGYVAETQIQKV